MVWLMLHQDLDRDPDTSTLGVRGVALLANLRTCTPEEEETDVYRHLIEDQTFLSKVVLVSRFPISLWTTTAEQKHLAVLQPYA